MQEPLFTQLREAPLHKFTAQDWPRWYAAITPWLGHDDAEIRMSAVERLAMAVFWSEFSGDAAQLPDRSERERERTAWLVDVIDAASTAHPDVTAGFLDQLRYKGDESPFKEVLVPWLQALKRRSHAIVPPDSVEGILLLIGGLGNWGEAILPPQFDHPSDFVRGCAAVALARSGYGTTEEENEPFFDTAFIEALTAAEIERPGIAGPFWDASGFGMDHANLGFDPVEWMLTIIEKRKGPEPVDLPSNGIDFHIHEAACMNPEAILRLLNAGRPDLAVMTATEIRDRVEDLKEVLVHLGHHEDPSVSLDAQAHLALYYNHLHERAVGERIRSFPQWRPNTDAFLVQRGDEKHPRYMVVLHPASGGFDDAFATMLIDTLLPPSLRGDLVPYVLAGRGSAPAPYRIGNDEIRSYSSGAQVDLRGFRDREGWKRVEIWGGRLGAAWQPFVDEITPSS